MAIQIKQFCVLLGVSTALFFVHLGGAHLWDEDEPIFAGAALEMAERADWIVPHFNGEALPDKPALMYWLMMAAYRVWGPTEFAARFASAVFGVASVLLTWRLGCRLFSARTGYWAGLALATSLHFEVIARAATPDAVLIFFSTLAIYAFAGGCFGARSGIRENSERVSSYFGTLTSFATQGCRGIFWLGSYAAMGLATLAKGPIGCLLPGAVIGLFLLIVRAVPAGAGPRHAAERPRGFLMAAWSVLRRTFAPRHVLRTLWSMRPLTALAVVIAVAGPWYAWVGYRTGGAWLAGFLGTHNLGRFLHPMENHRGPFFYYLPAILIGFFPWSVFLVPSLRSAWRDMLARRRRGTAYLLLGAWIAVYVTFFSLAQTKLPNYVLPAYPALALLVGAWLDGWLRRPRRVARRDLRVAWASVGLVGLGLVVALPLVAGRFFDGDVWLGLVGLPLMAGAVLAWRFAEHGRAVAAATTLATAAAAFGMVLLGWGALRIDRHQTSAHFAEVIRRNAVGDRPALGTCGYYRPSLVFYSGQPVRQLLTSEQVETFFRDEVRDAFLFTSDERYRELALRLPADVRVLDRKRWFLRTNQVVLLGRARTR